MKRITSIIVAICATLSVFAQTATEKVQQREKGKGSVTVTQSSAINDLINNKGGQQSKTTSATPQSKTTTSAQKPVTSPANSGSANVTSSTETPQSVHTEGDVVEGLEGTETVESVENVSSKPRSTVVKKRINPEEALDAEKLKVHEDYDYKTDDGITGPKMVRGEHKARGWRILVFTGGNKRIDRKNAQAAGKKVKRIYPGMPVYTHFYNPRWQTFCGNFHNHKEAESVKKELIKKGFKSACIVRTQIIVE